MTGRRTSQAAASGLILIGMRSTLIWAQKFYPDDPAGSRATSHGHTRSWRAGLSDLLEFFSNTFGEPGERIPRSASFLPGQSIHWVR